MASSAVLGGVSSISSSVANLAFSGNQRKLIEAQGEYEAQQHRANARFADIQAKARIRQGERDALDHRQQIRTLIGSNRANLAAQGLDLDRGSALDVQLNNAEIGAVEELRIKNNAWREAWGYRVQSSNYISQAQFAKVAAGNRSRAVVTSGVIGVIKSTSDVASRSATSFKGFNSGKITTSSGAGYRNTGSIPVNG